MAHMQLEVGVSSKVLSGESSIMSIVVPGPQKYVK